MRDALAAATEKLRAAGVGSARADAEQLAAHLLGVARTRLALVPLVEPAMLDAYRTMIDQRAKRIPLQYITGITSMGSVDIEVGPGVFVPRPETELLLAWTLAFLEAQSAHGATVIDLCTGSGALALAVAHARPDLVVHAVERDPRALDWARRNADHRSQAGDTPITLTAGDVRDPELLPELDGAVDVIIANPPYIPAGVVLEPEVAEYDPPQALFAGADGLEVIAGMAPNLRRWLRADGGLAIEHDDSNGAGVAALLAEGSVFVDITEHLDLAGKPRYVTARRAD